MIAVSLRPARGITLAFLGGLVMWAALIVGAVAVFAHQPTHTVDCAGISVSGRAYGHGATLTLTVNGVSQTQTRGRDGHFAGLSATFTDRGDNTWAFVFDDPDDRYDLTQSGVTQGCSGPTTTTTTTTTVAPTTTTPETTTWPAQTSTSTSPPSTSSPASLPTSSAPPATTSPSPSEPPTSSAPPTPTESTLPSSSSPASAPSPCEWNPTDPGASTGCTLAVTS